VRTDRASRGGVRGDIWAALARCESGGNPAARSANGRYTGAFQFSDATWHGLGYDGSAADHSYDVQVAAAQRLQARSGWGQWPRCSRQLGLR
jgi:soluble lytic murein transglycosylase-like protein